MKRKHFASSVTKADGETAACTISTEAYDREGDRLIAAGADLAAYKKNPVVLFGHDHRSLPVGRATKITATPGRGLSAEWVWNSSDEFGRRVREAWNGGFLNATSVGFLPREYDRNEEGGFDFKKWDVLEFSVVNVPANPEAVRHLKALGLSSVHLALSKSSRGEIPFDVALRRLRARLRRRVNDATFHSRVEAAKNQTLRRFAELFGGVR